ncbi:MAG: carboxylating nicotinate-nucleotide diphosphorylase [Gammaproteobacteria bacterium]|nr:carboxylating nicotinate-nucleotide diphosphorylase [Gammaproteobacteria bacterium]MDH5305332.1 carboxylating nicotinate-nucleotide diphosphorylase [Gammaproteobacteria bacterium]MDH5322518.1 carboxylating nicotinate-nucleotide diphosphorylase [Gammaproteobacteria bacterium]
MNDFPANTLHDNVALALAEDIGAGDLTAALISPAATIAASLITRDAMTMAGRPWFDEVLRQVDPGITVTWQHNDGDTIAAGATLCFLQGPARAILTAERTALNFLQLLSATATVTASYVAAVAGTACRILDTRKTIPGLRLAQKYAVRCGGGSNHRIGLFDAILIKENHILSAGGISAAIDAARELHPELPVEIEVETLDELRDALGAKAERLLLDNFSLSMLRDAVAINRDQGDPPAELEASGGVTLAGIREIAATGVDFISVGALTKNVQAIDLSMRFSSFGNT